MEGGPIFALAIDAATPTTLYAGTAIGVFKSTDGGRDWGLVNAGLTDTYVRALAIDALTPTTLYAGTHGGVFKSTDGGATWEKLKNGLPKEEMGRIGIAVSPADPDVVYAIVEARD